MQRQLKAVSHKGACCQHQVVSMDESLIGHTESDNGLSLIHI